jgi:RNA polymerase sigma-70 factor, ECF subfamily
VDRGAPRSDPGEGRIDEWQPVDLTKASQETSLLKSLFLVRAREESAVLPGEAAPGDPLEEAVVAFQAGRDREASFRCLVDSCYHPIRAFFARRVGSAEEALELTQDTFLRIYKGLDRFRRESRFRTWAFRVAHTTYLQWLERRGGRLEVAYPGAPGEEAAMEDHQAVAVERHTPLDAVLERELSERLAEAVGGLPEQERRCVTLRVYHDLSHQEIAELLGLAVGTVKAHLHHARQKLRTRLVDRFREIEL